jgi:sugar phosphate permease
MRMDRASRRTGVREDGPTVPGTAFPQTHRASNMFYGWKISLLSLGGNFMLLGGANYAMNAYMEPLCEVNGWSRGSINIALGLAMLAGQIAMPLAAAVAAKTSLRLLMTLGALAGGAATCFLGICHDIWLFTLLYVAVCVSAQACGGVVANALVCNWFFRYRGRAFGIVNSGTSLAGAVIPLISLPLIHNFGLTVGFAALGGTTLLLALACLLLVRDTPESMGLHADGSRNAPHAVHVPTKGVFSRVMHDPHSYAIGIAFGIALMCGSGIMSQLKPRFADIGITPYPAMLLACLAALCSGIVKYVWGWLSDRYTAITTTRLLMLMCLLSLATSFLPPNLPNMLLFSISFGCSIGGVWTLLPAMTTYYFGVDNFLPSYKFISIFIIIRCLGFPVMGLSHDLFGSYEAAYAVFTVCMAVSLGLTFLVSDRNIWEHSDKIEPTQDGK